ncbi:Uncharacterised protein [BD1-7 clade bacterium]|uniref:Uncharacterized protein n=1 Tax=BD1-7 clade bacterium TaxID=2029982 RepID=A0A5S9QSQ1_9GAMM|nr:Uncharacterised protein [BD1-7 clade bacterium]
MPSSFWASLPSLYGNSSAYSVWNSLHLNGMYEPPQGALTIYACVMENDDVVLAEEPIKGAVLCEGQNVYFLPYKPYSVMSASWADLESFHYFYTTKLAGCRFATNVAGVHHVPHHTRFGSDSSGREKALSNAPGGLNKARRLSCNNRLAVPGEQNNPSIYLHGAYDMEGYSPSCAYVFGFKQGQKWTFKTLKESIPEDAPGTHKQFETESGAKIDVETGIAGDRYWLDF